MKTAHLIAGPGLVFLFAATCSTLRAQTDTHLTPRTDYRPAWRS